ncbi:uncharacterized protein METZ01_LOCUS299129, partial [marine metagenome]
MLRRIFKPLVGDPPLFLAVSIMTVFGIGMIYSAGVLNIPSVVTEGAWLRQARWWALALGVFVAVRQVRAGWFEWIAVPAYIFSILLLMITLFVGKGSGTATGVRSFLDLGFLQFQPAELAKLATVLVLARYLANRPEDPVTLRALVAPTAIVGLPLALVVLQPDLGTVLAFVGILFATLFWAGVPTGLLILLMSPAASLILSYNAMIWAAFFLVLIVSLYLFRYRLFLVESLSVILANLAVGTVANPLWNSLAEYQKNRILVFLDPSVDPRGAGYHVVQSMVAIGSGGLSGKGFTQGTQKAFDFLPEQHTDFIFSVIGEELGFIGTVFTLVLFSFILYRLIRIAEEANPFAGLVIFGILGAWLMHIFVNVG